jgi:DNA polymerase III subunit epsilon
MNLLILDTETTGLDPANGQVIELGAILYSVDHQTILHQISTLMRAEANPAEQVNRIPSKVLPHVNRSLQDMARKMFSEMAEQAEYVVAHNAEFDAQWFPEGIVDEWGTPLPWLCTMSDFKFPLQTKPIETIVNLALAHGIGVSSAHRALTDCSLIAALFDRMENLPEMIAYATRPKATYIAMVSYDDRQLAKDAGFQWNGDRKIWHRRMAVDDICDLPFSVRVDPLSGPAMTQAA